MNHQLIVKIVLATYTAHLASACTHTTAIGTHAPVEFCAGDLIFEDNFDDLDFDKWMHENSLWGGGNNNEFQWYVNDRANSFVCDGNLHLRPTYTSSLFGEDFLYFGNVTIPKEECTRHENRGCSRAGDGNDNIINPIRSAKILTWNSFAFKYGTVEIRAKNPGGDWLWPALWLMPRNRVYGSWPRSGEIDIMESRGNRYLWSGRVHVGTELVASNLHFGLNRTYDGHTTAYAAVKQSPGYNEDFHVYKLVWTPLGIEFFVDGVLLRQIEVGDGFWARGRFPGENIWTNSLMGPFDQEFVIQINNAVGGTSFFNDAYVSGTGRKPWSNKSPRPAREFWEGRAQWEPSWNIDVNDERDFQIDYVRVWAV